LAGKSLAWAALIDATPRAAKVRICLNEGIE